MKIKQHWIDLRSESFKLDQYLVSISKKYTDHHFLGAATQGVYLRQVRFLKALCEANQFLPQNLNILDWGTGKGHITYLLNKEGFRVTSCDLNKNVSDSTFGQETPIIDENGIFVEPLDHPWKLPFSDGSFDIVVSFGVLEHVQSDQKSLIEVRRVLRTGGAFFFVSYRIIARGRKR